MRKISIRGWIELPSPQSFVGATAIVGLDDVTLIDALSTRIAETVTRGVIRAPDHTCGLRPHAVSHRLSAVGARP